MSSLMGAKVLLVALLDYPSLIFLDIFGNVVLRRYKIMPYLSFAVWGKAPLRTKLCPY